LAPLVFKRWLYSNPAWRQTSDLVLHNPNTQSASVTVTFYDSWAGDSGSHQETRTIPANGQVVINGTELPTWESGWGASLASAVVQSNRPLAAVVQTTVGLADGAGNITTPYLMGNYRAFSTAANAVYLPLAAREYYNYDSGFQVQNARNGNTTFTLKYYRPGQSQPVLSLTQTVGAYHSFNFWRPQGLPPDYLGSAVVEVTSGGPVVVVGQYDKVNNAQSRYGMNQYEGVTAGTWSEILPYVQWSSPWTWTGIMAQNMGSSATNVTLTFYNQDGAWAGSATEPGILPRTAPVFWQEISGFLGSAVASSDPGQPLGLVVNLDRLEATNWTNKDGLMGYSAVR
jgi:hypothetical protein